MKQGRRVLMLHKDYIVIIRKLKSIEYICGYFTTSKRLNSDKYSKSLKAEL
jgi:hypothetical protein